MCVDIPTHALTHPGVSLDSLKGLGEDGRGTVRHEELTANGPEEEASDSKPSQDNKHITHILASLDNCEKRHQGKNNHGEILYCKWWQFQLSRAQ